MKRVTWRLKLKMVFAVSHKFSVATRNNNNNEAKRKKMCVRAIARILRSPI